MSDYDYSDFRVISSILHAYSPNGKRVTLDFRLERYMIVLYAALHLPIFEQYKKRDGKNEGFTLYSLEGIANNLGYKFDRTKSSWKIYDNQEKEGKVRKKEIDNKTIYMLTKKGISYCEECVKNFLAMRKIPPSAWEPHTENTRKQRDHDFAKLKSMPEKEAQRWAEKNPGKLFSQPTKEEHKLDLLLQKIKSLS